MEFISELLAAVGGAVGIVMVLMTLARGLVQKWFESMIDSASQKTLAKFTNNLQRKTKAYEILLEKEFSFYENISPIMSDLIVDIQDFSHYLGFGHTFRDKPDVKEAKAVALKIIEAVPKLKRYDLLAHTYLPQPIMEACTQLINGLQDDTALMYEALKSVVDGSNNEDTENRVKEFEKRSLMNCAKLNIEIKNHLSELSNL